MAFSPSLSNQSSSTATAGDAVVGGYSFSPKKGLDAMQLGIAVAVLLVGYVVLKKVVK
jgi:hypothetical protein